MCGTIQIWLGNYMGIEEISSSQKRSRSKKNPADKKYSVPRFHQEKAGVSRSDYYARIMYRLSEDVNRACTRWEIARGTYVPDKQSKFGNARFN